MTVDMDDEIEKSLRFENYQVMLVKVDDKFQLCIPEIFLFASNKQLEKAYLELEGKFNSLKNDYQESQVLSAMPLPVKSEQNKNKNSVKAFALKFMIVTGLFISLSYFGAYIVTEKVNQISVANLMKQQIKGVQSFVDSWSNLNHDRKTKILLETESQLNEMKPFIRLIRSALEE